jgi:hypothetical protein
MVNARNFKPTETKFINEFKTLSGTKVRKGQFKPGKGFKLAKGFLLKIIKAEIDKNGWVVEVDGNKYNCSYDTETRKYPEWFETELYYIPKKKWTCEVALDTEKKDYKITNIIGLESSWLSFDGGINIEAPEEEDVIALKASMDTIVQVGKNLVTIDADSVKINGIDVNDLVNKVNKLEEIVIGLLPEG